MVDAVSSTASQISANAASSSATLSDNFDTFLSLLTAQLQNQDPLEPVDSTEFTNQLVQFSGVEQQIATNKALADLISITTASQAASLSGYLGKTIDVNTSVAELSGENVDWYYDLPEGVDSAYLSIQAESGNIVYSERLSDLSSGEHHFEWDGELANGQTATSGKFRLIVGAEDASQNSLSTDIYLRTQVTGVDLASGSTALATTAGSFDFSDVLRLLQLS